MKTKISKAFAFLLLMSLSVVSFAQHEKHGHGKKHHGNREERTGLQEVKEFSGKLGGWVNNENYVYDGFYLQIDTQKLLVKFHPYLGKKLTGLLKPDVTFFVNGVEKTSRLGEKEIILMSVVANEKTITDSRTDKFAKHHGKEVTKGTGKINEFQKNKMGDINGYILDNKTILRVSPKVGHELSTIAIAGASITYNGIKKSLKDGEVASSDYSIIKLKSITINGKQYLTN